MEKVHTGGQRRKEDRGPEHTGGGWTRRRTQETAGDDWCSGRNSCKHQFPCMAFQLTAARGRGGEAAVTLTNNFKG